MLCKECVFIFYGLQNSSLVVGILRQFLMEMVAIKCGFNDWLGICNTSYVVAVVIEVKISCCITRLS